MSDKDQAPTRMISPSRCPLCGRDNGCRAGSHESCWCNEVVVPQALIDQVPARLRGRACICRACVDQFAQIGKASASPEEME